MNQPSQGTTTSQQIQEGLDAAYEHMLAFKRYKQTPVVIVQNGQVVAVSPDELPPAASKAA
ncbi:hypothetical protein [Hymenobacter psychrophilus]|uniref:Uncharacterized protein n=1 Tax=Hymenobacter psychrophilus TaxID=651662 RepID=A0A1H3FMJ1_9BACT|nr:hypothetical protein [Hymenobacter psychrophilus]SDX91364.1 hypothetical protein SAMN04488069_104114 [Hymenobacter psychrophilus]